MKLLFDQNISRKLVKELEDIYPQSSHVYLLRLHKATDEKIWQYAKQHKYVIVSQDADFNERSLLYGYPPKVLLLKTSNTTTQHIKQLLILHKVEIVAFNADKTLGCLVIQ
jgi:predicted nuclease of predicted toxin-antitoxin system